MSAASPSSTAGPARASQPEPSHRRASRLPFTRKILIYPCDDPANGRVIATLQDFSPRGIGFRHTRAMRPGSQFILRLIEERGRPVPLLYTVRHCRTVGKVCHHMGAELTRVLGAEDPRPPRGKKTTESNGSEKADPHATKSATGTVTTAAIAPVDVPLREQAFDAAAARGFVRGRTANLTGQTLIGWDRIMDLRLDGTRIWIHLHPPGKDSGWGMFVDAMQLRTTLDQLCDSAPRLRALNAA